MKKLAIQLSDEVHEQVKKICQEKGWKITHLGSQVFQTWGRTFYERYKSYLNGIEGGSITKAKGHEKEFDEFTKMIEKETELFKGLAELDYDDENVATDAELKKVKGGKK